LRGKVVGHGRAPREEEFVTASPVFS
jgi:hypothetical protein